MAEDEEYGSSIGSTVPTTLEWRFGQVFGERAVGEEVQEGE